LSYEQYGSKQAFVFRHTYSEIFGFDLFFCPEQNPEDFADFLKILKPFV